MVVLFVQMVAFLMAVIAVTVAARHDITASALEGGLVASAGCAAGTRVPFPAGAGMNRPDATVIPRHRPVLKANNKVCSKTER